MRTLLGVAALLVLAACGDGTGAGTTTGGDMTTALPDSVPPAEGPVTTQGPRLVLDDGDGPTLCLAGGADSLPPQCEGTPLVGWEWADHEGDHEQRSGVRWGEFVVTGTFDGEALTVTEVVPASEYDAADPAPVEGTDTSTPCPEPEGGWGVRDPARTTYATLDAATTEASRIDGLGMVWIDQSVPGEGRDGRTNGPRGLILNVSVTGDLARAEAAVREVWGGMLCVSEARFSESEMREIQTRLHDDVPGAQVSGFAHDEVDLGVVHDDGSIQAWADAEFGTGVVEVTSALVPAEG